MPAMRKKAVGAARGYAQTGSGTAGTDTAISSRTDLQELIKKFVSR